MVYSDPNNTNSIVYQHTLLSYQLKASHWNFSRAATLHLCNMADRGEKLQQPHCYHPFSDSRDIYLTKNHHENYSPKMVPTNPTGSWSNCLRSGYRYVISPIVYIGCNNLTYPCPNSTVEVMDGLLYLTVFRACYPCPNSGAGMMTSSNGNIFRVTRLLRGEFTGDRWIPRTKASEAELWCFLWSAPE